MVIIIKASKIKQNKYLIYIIIYNMYSVVWHDNFTSICVGA